MVLTVHAHNIIYVYTRCSPVVLVYTVCWPCLASRCSQVLGVHERLRYLRPVAGPQSGRQELPEHREGAVQSGST